MNKKVCTKCQVSKPAIEFYREKKARDGRRTDCKVCSGERRRSHLGQLSRQERSRRVAKRREKHAVAERAYSKRRREKYRANELIHLAKTRAKKKNSEFDLENHIDELTRRVDQNVCEMTGMPLQRAVPKALNSPSLDRVDPSKGYVYSNVRVICYALNCALGTWGEARLIEIVNALTERRS